MIIWLVSYPRSGNTLLRIILNHVFGLKTYSLYNDMVGVGADKATTEIVGHTFLPPEWSPDQARLDKELWLIKTHEVPQDDEKAIYIIRDGREVSVSYLDYLHNYRQQEDDLFAVIIGAVNFGSWSDHVLAWNPLGRENTLLLRFEGLAANPEAYIPAIANFLECEPISKSIPTFADLHAINPTFFRSGRRDSWKSVFNQDHHYLFWLLHHDVMIKYGYTDDMLDIFRRGLSPSEQDFMIAVKEGFKVLRQQREASLKQQSERLQQYREQLKRQEERLQQQEERLQRQNEQLQRQNERLQRQEERLQRQEERLQRLAAQNRNLNLELSQLRNSWSWKMTAPLRKVDNVLRSINREKMRIKEYRERGSIIRVIKNGKNAVSKVKNVIQPVSKRQKKSYHYALIEDLKRYTRIPKERVLVVGCNKGLECDLFRQNGAEDITGLDIIEGIGKDYPHPRTQYTRGSAEDMPFEDGTFNLVASFATLEHIPNPKAALEEMIRVTARNGVIYCQAAPLWNSPFGHHRKNFFPDDPWIHIRTKSPEEMKTFYAEYCNPNVGGVSIYAYIDYLYTKAFNRVSTREYKAILAGLLDKISPIAVRFNMNLEHRQLYTEEILEELKDYTEEELLTEGLTVVLRKV